MDTIEKCSLTSSHLSNIIHVSFLTPQQHDNNSNKNKNMNMNMSSKTNQIIKASCLMKKNEYNLDKMIQLLENGLNNQLKNIVQGGEEEEDGSKNEYDMKGYCFNLKCLEFPLILHYPMMANNVNDCDLKLLQYRKFYHQKFLIPKIRPEDKNIFSKRNKFWKKKKKIHECK